MKKENKLYALMVFDQTPCPECGKLMPMDELGIAGIAAVAYAPRIHPLPGVYPRPGCASVCIHCTAFLVIKHDLTLRSITDEEFKALEPEQKYVMRTLRKTLRGR